VTIFLKTGWFMKEDFISKFRSERNESTPPPPPPSSLQQRIKQVQKVSDSIELMVRQAYGLHASDIHIRVGEVPRLRLRGNVVFFPKTETITQKMFDSYLQEILTTSQQEQFAKTKEIDTAILYPGFVRCRINCFQSLNGGAIVLRLISLHVPSIESLGLPGILKELITKKQGLILVTGATGSGKSTTQAAMINHLNQTAQKHIVTIEDPIEYVHTSQQSLISQREVGLHTNEFHQALRSVLREDPDVIMIGEMRDRSTIETALAAAQTGHLVIATLHTRNALGTINRLLSIYTPDEQATMRVQILDSLVAVIAQILLPTTDASRTVAMELLINTPAMQDYLMKEQESEALQLMETSIDQGMQVMNHALCELMLSGRITIDTGVGASSDPSDLRRRGRNQGLDPSRSTKRERSFKNYDYSPR
jgi:twitching motility protein PilT